MRDKRDQWKEHCLGIDPSRLVFLDESGININMTRRYGRSIGQTRVVDHVPLNTPQCLTVLAAMRQSGDMVFTTYQGGTTGQRLIGFLKDQLVPWLRPGDVVVMDNMRSHHVDEVKEILCAAGVTLLYLPPYSPDLNPIEMLWSKLKSILRKWAVRLAADLPDAVFRALKLILPLDCCHWFAADGYYL
ncbi:MAG: IS630 family transposase [Eubacteriales bacterium]|nr:IS630 family transposase [Eubacteriales bacterium]